MVVGFSCKTKSKLNPQKKHVNVCKEGVGETGRTWKATFDYVVTYVPHVVILENVVDLDDVSDPSMPDEASDASYIQAEFVSKGYAAKWMHVDAENHGSPARRLRLYLIAVRIAAVANMAPAHAILDNVAATIETLQVDAADLSHFVCLPGDPLLDIGPNIPEATAQDPDACFKYQTEHREAYEREKLPYPPDLDTLTGMSDCDALVRMFRRGAVTRRHAELIAIMHHSHPYTSGLFEFFDFQMSSG